MVRTRDDDGEESTARRVTFEERQTLPSWFGPAVVALSVPTLVVTVVVVFETEGATRESLALGVLLALVVLGPLPLLFRSALRTEIRDDGVFFRFSPFHLSIVTSRSRKSRTSVGASAARTISDSSVRGGVGVPAELNGGRRDISRGGAGDLSGLGAAARTPGDDRSRNAANWKRVREASRIGRASG